MREKEKERNIENAEREIFRFELKIEFSLIFLMVLTEEENI
jgi:hypothetical protein